ncbi:MAG: helix-turn-helix transcriptional regulator [Streptomyces sp.]|nr:helix-turn-helix transcriptional regulator [Streptomyces sp.]
MTAPVMVGPSSPSGGPVPSLTPREVEFLERLAQGQTAQDIARAWFYEESSARTIGDRLRKKLGAKTNAQAVLVACRAGILDGRPRSQRHGDHGGYTNHQKRREEACAACKEGERAYQVQRRAARKNARIGH